MGGTPISEPGLDNRSVPPEVSDRPGRFREFAVAMALRPLFAPLRPDLDSFLFAVVREERKVFH